MNGLARWRCRGQFAIRGGIIDIYPLTEEYPVRVELWDDEVDSIRSFDAESQRSLENMDELTLYPAAELNPEEHHCEGVSLLDYMKQFRSLVFLDEGVRLLERGETVEKEYLQNFENRDGEGTDSEKSEKRDLLLYGDSASPEPYARSCPCDTGKF